MGLFDSFMPGESSGIPTGGLLGGGWQGALEGNNPMLNIGLGILANNSGNYGSLGAALGRGAQQGIQNTQASRQAQQQAAMYKLQMAKAQKDLDEQKAMNDAISQASQKNPEMAALFKIDPKSAIKALYPQAGGADPYFTPVYDSQRGLGAFDNRKGVTTWQEGSPIVKPADDPALRGRVKSAESQASADYKINTDIDGNVLTDAQVADMARGGMPPKFGTPSLAAPMQATQNAMQIPPQVQKQRDDVRMKILMDEQTNAGGQGANPDLDREIANMRGGGIRVPTKAQQAGAEAQAKANVELATSPQIESATTTAKLQAENAVKAQQDLPKAIANGELAIKQVDELLSHKGFKTAVGLSSKLDPRNYMAGTDAAGFKARFEQSKGGTFLQGFESLKGSGAITEKEGEKATTAIDRMSTATTEEEFKTAARDYQNAVRAGINRAKMKAGKSNGANIMPKNEKMPKQSTISKGGWSAKKVP